MNKVIADNEKFGGVVVAEVIRDSKDGPVVINRQETHNLVVNTGKRAIWRQAGGIDVTHLFKYFRIGTSAAAATAADTNVKTPVGSSLRICNSFQMSGQTFQLIVSYQSGAATTVGGVLSAAGIAEVCVLNSVTTPGGSALMRAIFSSTVNKTKSDKLKISYNVKVS